MNYKIVYTIEIEVIKINFLFSRNLASNMILSFPNEPFKGLDMLHDLLLSDNKLQVIPGDAFTGLSRLQVL